MEIKKKILFPINSDLYIRNYVKTGVLSKLEKKFDLFFIANTNVKNINELNKLKNFIGFFKYKKKEEIRHQRILNTLMWRYRKISSSFFYRLKWFSQILIKKESKTETLKYSFLNFLNVIKFRIYIQFFGNFFIFPLYKKFYMIKTKPNLTLNNLIKKISPDIILVPSQAQCSMDNDLIKICNQLNIKSIFLIDNWDNLSDKSLMWNKPDLVGVWGEQSRQHAIKIQRFQKEKVINIGTPRFENYFKERDNYHKSYFDFDYILFLGTALEFDEIKILKIIDNYIIKNKSNIPKTKIIYRPHPWRMATDKIKLSEFENVIIDPQVEKNYFATQFVNTKFQPEINYYTSLLKNCKFVVGGLTSMIIESTIFYKNYIVSALPEDQFNNQYNSLKYMVHFKELNSLSNIMLTTNIEELEISLSKSFNEGNIKNQKKNIDNQRRFFLFDDDRDYSARLLDLVNKLI